MIKSAAVLAGGRATRLPGKPLAQLGRRTLVMHAVAAVRAAGLTPVIAGKRADDALRAMAEAESLCYLGEPDEPVHPLFGVANALEALGEPIVVIAADMPFVPPPFLRHLAGHSPVPGGAAVVEVGGRLEPLLGSYDPGAREHLAAAAELEASAQQALRALGPLLDVIDEPVLTQFGDPQRLVWDVDDPAALAAAESDMA